MICPLCKKSTACVTVDSRSDKVAAMVWRRKECKFCNSRFSTVEVLAKLQGRGRESRWVALGKGLRRKIY